MGGNARAGAVHAAVREATRHFPAWNEAGIRSFRKPLRTIQGSGSEEVEGQGEGHFVRTLNSLSGGWGTGLLAVRPRGSQNMEITAAINSLAEGEIN
jgi:hypothetical protein